jgi:hypothetical protein
LEVALDAELLSRPPPAALWEELEGEGLLRDEAPRAAR